ncbi:MAG: O-antigen ligase family protein [Bacteroidales bacterium]|nr:O-antigen ligase family protein [Bacteroidales bacterium]
MIKKYRTKPINPNFIIIMAFFSTFKNANIYLIGSNQNLMIGLDYLFSTFVTACFSLIVLKSLKSFRIDRKVKYFLPLLTWIVTKSLVLTFFASGEYIPRNLITAFLCTAVIVLSINDIVDFRKVVWSFAIGAGISALIPLILHPEMIGYRSGWLNGVHFRGGFWNFTLISFVSAGWIAIALAKNSEKKYTRLLSYLIFLTTWIAAFAGLSRTLLLMSFVGIATYLLYTRRIKPAFKMGLLVLVLVIITFKFFPGVVANISERINLTQRAYQDEGRVVIWRHYLENASEYFVVGALGNYRDFDPAGHGPHSVFLNWLVQYGLIGLIGFMYLIWGLLKEIKRVTKYSRDEAALLLAWLTSYLTLSSINQTGFIEASFYVGFGIVLTWTKLHKEDEHSSSISVE